MALTLSDLVVCGELIATRHYGVHGWIGLRGAERPISLQLTGNPDPDLAGRHIRFEARPASLSEEEQPDADQSTDLTNFAWQQIGPTGTMTAARMVRVADCPSAELYHRARVGEPPPTEWKRSLYLEWFGQNGRVVVELVDPLIEEIPPDKSPASDPSDETPEGPGSALGVGGSGLGEDDPGDSAFPDSAFDDIDLGESRPEDDPYSLFPEDLEREFETQARDLDRQIESDEDKPKELREMELLDDLIENSDGEPIISLFDGPLKLPRPDDLQDEEAEQALKTLLAQLAVFGIALDVCKHFTPRDAYRLLLEEICVEERAYPELRQTQWVQHFMTSEYCEQCDAEMEEEFRRYEDRRDEPSADDGPSGLDDDIPF